MYYSFHREWLQCIMAIWQSYPQDMHRFIERYKTSTKVGPLLGLLNLISLEDSLLFYFFSIEMDKIMTYLEVISVSNEWKTFIFFKYTWEIPFCLWHSWNIQKKFHY